MTSIYRILYTAAAALLTASGAMAQDGLERAQERARAGGRKSVGLVLSGGGAKGVAHISAIRALEEAGIPIDYIAGTSMGAIIGGLYAIGYDTHTLDSMVRTQNWPTLIYDRVSRTDLSYGAKEQNELYLVTVEIGPGNRVQLPSGFISGHNIYNLLYELTYGYHTPMDFHDLPIPFECVAYDMVSGRSVALASGSLPESIRASMSIPGAFQAVDMGEMLLVDGGIGNNFPVDIVRRMGAEIVVGIDVTAPLKTKEELTSFADIFDQITSFTALEAYNKNLREVDLYIHPDISGYNAASFSAEAIDTLLNRGRAAMIVNRDRIYALRDRIGLAPGYAPEVRRATEINPPICIGRIEFEGLLSENERVLRRIIGIRENSVISGEELQNAMNKLSGMQSFSNVHYRLEGDPQRHTLIFAVEELHRNTLSAGFRFDTEDMAAILLNLRYSSPTMKNSYFDITGRLGANPYGTLSYIYGNETQRRFNSSFTFRSNDLKLYSHGDRTSNFDFDQSTVDLSFSNIRARNFRLALGVRYDYYNFHSFITNVETTEETLSQGLFSYYGLAHYESFDSRYYPRKGTLLQASYTLATSNFAEYKGGIPFSALQFDWLSAFSISKRVTFIPGAFGRVLIGDKIAYPLNNFMGGSAPGRYLPHQIAFVGISSLEQFDRSVVGLRFETRIRLWMKNYISLRTNYARHQDNFFELLEGKNLLGVGVIYSYNSFIGPIDLLVDYSNHDKRVGFYLNIGYYF